MPRTLATGRQRGFTLLELLVVLAILVLLTAALPVALPRLVPGQQLRVESASLAAALRLTRDETVLSGRRVELELNPAGTELARDGGAVVWKSIGGTDVMWKGEGSIDPNDIQFWPDGSASGGAFVLKLANHTATISLSPMTGRVTVEDL